MASVITVDVGALRTLVGRINTARAALENDSGLFADGGGNGVEHPKLRSSLGKFDERWSDKRHKISDSLEKTSKAMDNIASSFAEADDELARCVLDDGGGKQ